MNLTSRDPPRRKATSSYRGPVRDNLYTYAMAAERELNAQLAFRQSALS